MTKRKRPLNSNERYAAEIDRLLATFRSEIMAGNFTTPEAFFNEQRKTVFANINDKRRASYEVRLDMVSLLKFTMGRDSELQAKYDQLVKDRDAADQVAAAAEQASWPAFNFSCNA